MGTDLFPNSWQKNKSVPIFYKGLNIWHFCAINNSFFVNLIRPHYHNLRQNLISPIGTLYTHVHIQAMLEDQH